MPVPALKTAHYWKICQSYYLSVQCPYQELTPGHAL